ncbi:MAG: S8 family serine peptidase [Candidatus Krumholzibacteriota bacterium]|nr:S8 family serine peptidase [Candidatus Krumholzibacteriota bacterium]
MDVSYGTRAKSATGTFRARRPAAVLWLAAGLAAMMLAAAARSTAGEKPGETGIGHRLAVLVDAYERGGFARVASDAATADVRLRTEGAAALIPVVIEPAGRFSSAVDLAAIRGLGARIDAVSRSYVRILSPPGAVRLLPSVPGVAAVRLATPARSLAAGLGSTVSEGVDLTGAGDLQAAGFDGAGVRIAVVDLGFIGLDAAQVAGELPATVHRVKGNVEGVDISGFTVHGTGVAEHVMDMAPGAELYCILVEDEVDLENAADFIRENGIHVANHSVGWVLASYYDDTGPIAGIVNRSRDVDGIFWAVAAGNDAQTHWRGDWYDADEDDTLEFAVGDEDLAIIGTAPTIQLFLNWNQYGDSRTDLDLYVLDNAGRVVAAGGSAQTGPQPPAEAVAFTWVSSEAPYSIRVHRYAGPTGDLDMTIFSFNHRLEHAVASSSLMEPADAHGAFSVGAIYRGVYDDPDPPLEAYSSRGPTNDGRLKPDIVAPDGTTSVTYGSSFGTSFSSPTTAGAAALLKQLYPSIAPPAMADTLRARAIDAGTAGPDDGYGAGRLFVSSMFDGLPAVETIEDVPGDEGLLVEIAWKRSGYDRDGSPVPVTAYDILRRAGGGWDSLATVSATGALRYAAAVQTRGDSSAAGIVWTVLRIRARTGVPGIFFESPPDSGYSVADLLTGAGDAPPAAPFVLSQNVPNPFNPSTAIRFSLRERSPVRLAVYDVGGRLVGLLVDGTLSAGPHEVRWDGRDRHGRAVASGIYFYRLAVPGEAVTRKMTLLR